MSTLLFLAENLLGIGFIAWVALCLIRPEVAPRTVVYLVYVSKWLYACSHGYVEFMEALREAWKRGGRVQAQCYADLRSGMEEGL